MNSEYSGPSVSGSSCAYVDLHNYNNQWQGKNQPAIPKGNVTGHYIVPQYGMPGYSTLTSKKPSCSGYFGISNAYGHFGKSCGTKFVSSLCNSSM